MEYGSSIEDFLESIYIADIDFTDSGIEEQAKNIERSNKMLRPIDSSVNLLRKKHKKAKNIIGFSIAVFFLRSNVEAQK